MIIKETIKVNGEVRYKTYSDENRYIRKVGTDEEYEVAIDVVEVEYEETNRYIENEEGDQ